jgi:protein required for attachment to host cells
MEQVADFRWPEGRRKSRELVSDRPGRSFDSWTRARGGHQAGSPRHGLSSHDDPKEHSAKLLSEKLATFVGSAHAEGRFGELFLVAEPHLLGRIRSAMDKSMKNVISGEQEKDYAWLSHSQLSARLKRFLPKVAKGPERWLPRGHLTSPSKLKPTIESTALERMK